MTGSVDDILFVSAQPDVPYFHWQIKVYVKNFTDKGIPPDNINILLSYSDKPSNAAKSLSLTLPNVHLYKDERASTNYIPSIKPYLISKWLKEDPSRGKKFFLHDSDIIFNKLPDFSMLTSDRINYLSDTKGYIGYDYLMECGSRYTGEHGIDPEQLLRDMAKVIGISPGTIKLNNNNSGGAQYFLKSQTAELWDKVYRDSMDLYNTLQKFTNKYPLPAGAVQIWTAEMWSILWNLWYCGHEVKVHDELSFSWATDSVEKFNENNIFHLAGVTEVQRNELFYKGDHINNDPLLLLEKDKNHFDFVDKENATSKYVEAMIRTVKK